MNDNKQTKKEQEKEAVYKLVTVLKELEEIINQSVIDEELRSKIDFKLKELKSVCEAQKEALRLSKIVIVYDLSEKQKGFYKHLYLKELNKILN